MDARKPACESGDVGVRRVGVHGGGAGLGEGWINRDRALVLAAFREGMRHGGSTDQHYLTFEQEKAIVDAILHAQAKEWA